MHNGLAHNGGNWKKTAVPRAKHVRSLGLRPKLNKLARRRKEERLANEAADMWWRTACRG